MSNISPKNRCSGSGRITDSSFIQSAYCPACGRRGIKVTVDQKLWVHSAVHR